MKKPLKKVIFAVAALAAFALFAVLAGTAWLASPWGEAFLRDMVTGRLSSYLDRDVRLASVDTNVISSLGITGLAVGDTTGGIWTPILTVERLTVAYTLSDLFRRSISLESIRGRGISVTARHDSSGFIDIPDREPGDTAGGTSKPSFSLSIGSVNIEKCSFRYHNRSIPLDARVFNTAIDIRPSRGGSRRWSVRADSLAVDYSDTYVAMGQSALEGTYEDGIVRLASITLDIPRTELTGSGALAVAAPDSSTSVSLDIKGDVSGPAGLLEGVIPPRLFPLGGRFSITARTTSRGQGFGLYCDIGLEDGLIAGIPVASASVRGSYGDGGVRFDAIEARAFGGMLSGSGSIKMREGYTHRFSADFEEVRLERILKELRGESPAFSAVLSGSVAGGGELAHALDSSLEATLEAADVRRDTLLVGDFTGTAAWEDGSSNIVLRRNETTIEARGIVLPDSLSLAVEGDIADLTPFGVLFGHDITGSGEIEGTVTGPWDGIGLSADFRGSGLTWRSMPVDSLRGGIARDSDGFRLQKTVIHGSGADGADLGAVFGMAGFGGTVGYRMTFEGPFGSIDGDIHAEFDDPSYRGLVLGGGQLDFSFDDTGLRLEHVNLASDSLTIMLSGAYRPDAGEGEMNARITAPSREKEGSLNLSFSRPDSSRWRIDADGSAIPLDPLRGVYPPLPDLGGALAFSAGLTLGGKGPSGTVTVAVESPRFGRTAVDSLAGRIDVAPGLISLASLSAYTGGKTIDAEGDVTYRRNPQDRDEGFVVTEARGRLNASDIAVGPLLGSLPGGLETEGSMSARISFRGIPDNPRYEGFVRLENGMFRLNQDSHPIEGVGLSAGLADSVLTIESLTASVRGEPLEIGGTITVHDRGRVFADVEGFLSGERIAALSGTVDGKELALKLMTDGMDMALLRPFVPVLIDLDGDLTTEARVRGGIGEPEVDGSVTVENASFKTAVFNRPLTDGYLSASFKGSAVNIDSLSFNSHDGTVTGGGSFVLGEGLFNDLDLHMAIRDVKVDQPDSYEVWVDRADLTWKKNGLYYDLAGNAELRDGSVEYSIQPQAIILSRRRRATAAKQQRPPEFLDRTRLDVRVVTQDDIMVDNNLAHMGLDAGLEVGGTAVKPRLSGRVTATSGYVLYLDRRFDISYGSLDFTETEKINPIVEFQASTNIQSSDTFAGETYVITLNVNGPVDDAVIVLNSSPEMSRPDILALLTFGATANQLAGSSTSGEEQTTGAIMTERVTQLSGRMASNYLSRKASSLLGIEGLNIEGNIVGSSSGDRTKASERLSRQLESDYSTNVGQMNDRGIRLEYILSRFWSVEGYTSQSGRSGLDLEYSITFK